MQTMAAALIQVIQCDNKLQSHSEGESCYTLETIKDIAWMQLKAPQLLEGFAFFRLEGRMQGPFQLQEVVIRGKHLVVKEERPVAKPLGTAQLRCHTRHAQPQRQQILLMPAKMPS